MDSRQSEHGLSDGRQPERAFLKEAKLSKADLSEADLRAANLVKAIRLTQAQIDLAQGDEKTKLPPNLERPAHWSKGDEE